MVWGGWGDEEKSYASMSAEFELFGREKSQENHQKHFLVFNTSNSSPILLFCPRNPKSFLFENTKDAHRKMDRNPRRQKLIWSHMVPFGVNSDASFRAQRLRIPVRGCVFSYRRDSKEPWVHEQHMWSPPTILKIIQTKRMCGWKCEENVEILSRR